MTEGKDKVAAAIRVSQALREDLLGCRRVLPLDQHDIQELSQAMRIILRQAIASEAVQAASPNQL